MRALIEFQGILITIQAGTLGTETLAEVVMVAIELFLVKTMFGIVKKMI